MAATLPSIDQLRKTPAVTTFHGVRVVQCDLTGQLLTNYAALPVVKAGKGGKIKTTFRGCFADYETAAAYVNLLHVRGDIGAQTRDDIYGAITAHLGFVPTLPSVDPSMLAPFGPVSLGDWHSSYTHTSATHPGALFAVPDKKPEKEHKDKYLSYRAKFEKGNSVIDDNSTGTTNNFTQYLKPWSTEPNQAYSFLVTMDGTTGGPQQIVVQDYPTPKDHAGVLGLKPAKGPERGHVLRAQKPAKPAPVAADLVAQIDKAIAEVKPKRKIAVKQEADKPAKKRKAATVSA